MCKSLTSQATAYSYNGLVKDIALLLYKYVITVIC